MRYSLIVSKDIFSLEVKISFALLFIKRVINNNLIFELNSNYKKLFENFFYAIEDSKINIASKQIFNNNINLRKLKKSKIDN